MQLSLHVFSFYPDQSHCLVLFLSVCLSVWGRLYRRVVWLSTECLEHFLQDFASCPPCFRWTLSSEQMLIRCFPILDESFFSCFQEFLFQQSDYILRHDFALIYFRADDCADGYINEIRWASNCCLLRGLSPLPSTFLKVLLNFF